jgi:hypothetical protein
MEIESVTTDNNFMDYELSQEASADVDPEDYEGASFDDAFHDLEHIQTIEWPNDAYQEFMGIINKYQLSNSAGDAIINFFNKFSNLDVSPLPSSTKIGKEFLDNSTASYAMFKEIPVKTFQNITYTFYYQSLIKAIKSLISIDSINQSLVFRYKEKYETINSFTHQVFEEQYNCNWWKYEESNLLVGQ